VRSRPPSVQPATRPDPAIPSVGLLLRGNVSLEVGHLRRGWRDWE